MDHGLEVERSTIKDLLRLADELSIPLGRHQRPALHPS
jgi:hypothetical protein